MTRGQTIVTCLVGGLIGDIITGFLLGFPFMTIAFAIAGLVIPVNKSSENSGSSSKSKEEYKAIYQKLPKEPVVKLGGTILLTLSALGVSPEDMPQEMLKMGSALSTIKEEDKYGTISITQRENVDKLVDDFCQHLQILIPIANRTMNTAADTGLDFGIIGSATAVALYDVMDIMEKRKNFKTASRATNGILDDKVRELTTAIQNAL